MRHEAPITSSRITAARVAAASIGCALRVEVTLAPSASKLVYGIATAQRGVKL
jgi:hypothetical protein